MDTQRIKLVSEVKEESIYRDIYSDKADMEKHGYEYINFVVCNLYPFEKTISNTDVNMDDVVENIDIGGVTILRTTSKNFKRVSVVCDPNEYPAIIAELNKNNGELSEHACHQMPASLRLNIRNNPVQKMPLTVLNGSPGYVNLCDTLNAWQLVKELSQATTKIISREVSDGIIAPDYSAETLKIISGFFKYIFSFSNFFYKELQNFMISNVKTSILPLALWTENSPVHNITSILHLDKSNVIVTGSECGHIIIWSTKACDNQLVPLNYIIGHRSRIITLVLAGSRKHTDIDYFVSFSKDGELGLWETDNGRSLEFVSNASFDVQSVISFESENLKQRLLFCCLKSPEIVIINSMSLSELCTLTYPNCANIFSSVTSFNISTKDDMILATTVSGLTPMWILNFADINTTSTFNPKISPDKSLKIDVSNAIKITHNPHQTKIVLIISACKLMIYHAKDWSILCYQDCHRGDYFVNGEFISANHFLMHCQSGKSLYYKLPPRSDVSHPSFGLISSNVSDNIPHLIYQFKEAKELISLHVKDTTKISDNGFIIWKGVSDGSIFRWNYNPKSSEVEPQMFSLSSSWKVMKRKPSSLANMFVDPSQSSSVTSLLYIPDLSLFVLGMYDGSIFITNFENTLGSVFRKKTQTQARFIKLKGHCGPVLCLIHPCSTMKLPSRLMNCSNPKAKACLEFLKLTYILWSGSEDFSIRIWNMKTKQCLEVFHCHSAPVIVLRLNHLPTNSVNVYGFSQGMAAPIPYINDDDTNNEDIRLMKRICMNAFMVSISNDDAISIISMLRPKLLLYSSEHDSPIKSLGWLLDNRCVLLETVNGTVYVWDLSSKTMDRYETGEKGQSLMENSSIITKVRSQNIRKANNVSDMIGRHSLSNLTTYQSCERMTLSNKFIRFQFIKTGLSDRYVPVIIFDLSVLLNSLDTPSHDTTKFYSLLSEVENSIIYGFRSSDYMSDFDTLMMEVTAVNRDMDLKILLVEIIFSRAHFQHQSSQIDLRMFKFLDLNTDIVSSTFGTINTKTGCVTFNLKDLFKADPCLKRLTVENVLLQLSICNKITNSSQRVSPASMALETNIEMSDDLLSPRNRSVSVASNNFSDYNSSTLLTKLLLAYHGSIIDLHTPMLVQKSEKKIRFSDFPQNLSFCSMEKLFHTLILGILDVSDWISSSAYQILVKMIGELTYQEIQNYFIFIRTILLPDLKHYTTEIGRSFSDRIQSYLPRFSEQTFVVSDWIWWHSSYDIKVDLDNRKLIKIQIKALVYLALIGTYLPSGNSTKSIDDGKQFDKLFSQDNYFLAKISCDFMLNLLCVDVPAMKRTKNRLIGLAMLCLSNGFTVWEPYLSGSALILQLFTFTDDGYDNEEGEEDEFLLTSVARQSLRTIALLRPSLYVLSCYHEMVRLQNGQTHYNSITNSISASSKISSLQRMKSSPAFMNSYAQESPKMDGNPPTLNVIILFRMLEELSDVKEKFVEELLPEIVELYLFCNVKLCRKEVDLQHLLYPFLKFSSVSIDVVNGHVAVGSSGGSLALFSYKIGKYFSTTAHKKSVDFTQFSGDSKHVATYSVNEAAIKIWQISHSGLFNLSNNPYHVKMVMCQELPSFNDLILSINHNPVPDVTDYKVKEKKPKRLKKSGSKIERPSSLRISEDGPGLHWNPDNKTVSINFNGMVLREFKL